MSHPMSDEVKKRLDRILWQDRLKKCGLAFALLGVFALLMGYRISHEDSVMTHIRLAGVVSQAKPMGQRKSYNLTIRLNDGRTVHAISSKGFALPKGTQVEVDEAVFASGRNAYKLLRVIH